MLYGSNSLDALVNGAHEASISTHGASAAIAAASATAAAVSAAIDGRSGHEVLVIAERAAADAERRWHGSEPAAFALAIRAVHEELRQLPAFGPTEIAAHCFPDRPLTIVPLALALATLLHSAEDAVLLAANIGGDSDSVASIAGGILGAMYPATVNQQWCDVVRRVNGHDFSALATAFAEIRH